MDYYIVTRKVKSVKRTNRNGPDGVFDYYYILDADKKVIEKYDLKVLERYAISRTQLAVPR